jgi:hypothetical protein
VEVLIPIGAANAGAVTCKKTTASANNAVPIADKNDLKLMLNIPNRIAN